MITETEKTDVEELDLEEHRIHDVLRNSRRCKTIKYLVEHDGPISIRELSEHIAEEETDESPATREAYKSVYVSLHQNHLPKLDDLDIIHYDSSSKDIHLNGGIDQIEMYMGSMRSDSSYGGYYIGLSALALLAVVGSSLSIPLVSSVGMQTWFLAYLSTVTFLSLYILWNEDAMQARLVRKFG